MKCVHQGALRLVERFRNMCKAAIEDDPLQPVTIIYEENLSKIKRDLGTAGVEPTEFEALGKHHYHHGRNMGCLDICWT